MTRFAIEFCQHCGARLNGESRQRQLRRECSGCGAIAYRNPAVGVAVVVLDGDSILLGRRARGLYAGSWCIPCGYVEWGEDVRAAARREFQEETGLEVELGEVIAAHSNFHDSDKLTVGVWFGGVVIGGTLQAADDLDQVRFFPLKTPPALAFPTDELVIRDLGARG